jgi:transposase
MTTNTTNITAFAAFIGLDWADQKHDISLQAAEARQVETLQLEHRPEALHQWVAQLRTRFGGRPIALALEQKRGALIYALLPYEFIVLYPINPKALARYREAFATSGAKDDPVDAAWLREMVQHQREKLRPWKPDDPLTRELALLVEQRRRLVDQRTALTNRLTALLKQYFPQALDWVGPLEQTAAMDFLRRWPQLADVQGASTQELTEFYQAQGRRLGDKLPARLAEIQAAQPLTTDTAILRASVGIVQALVESLRGLVAGLTQLEAQLASCFRQHPDQAVFSSFPGAGAVLAPRLLVACGSDRTRFADAASLQTCSGIAPVTRRSGKSKSVKRRLACPTFVRQSFHEFAGCSLPWSRWARAYYDQQRKDGAGHHAALRALAYKWQRIIFRCWQSRQPYDEALYIASLVRRGSPLGRQLQAEMTPA